MTNTIATDLLGVSVQYTGPGGAYCEGIVRAVYVGSTGLMLSIQDVNNRLVACHASSVRVGLAYR